MLSCWASNEKKNFTRTPRVWWCMRSFMQNSNRREIPLWRGMSHEIGRTRRKVLLKSEKQRDFCSLPLQARYSPACGERSDFPMETCSLPRIVFLSFFFFIIMLDCRTECFCCGFWPFSFISRLHSLAIPRRDLTTLKMTRKPLSHVWILIYRTWATGNVH